MRREKKEFTSQKEREGERERERNNKKEGRKKNLKRKGQNEACWVKEIRNSEKELLKEGEM